MKGTTMKTNTNEDAKVQMQATAFTIPYYPCDRKMFPGSQLSPDDEREETTFFQDFSIAEELGGLNAVKETFRCAFNAWKTNIKYLTELAVVLNHKCWEWNKRNQEISKYYSDRYYQVYDYILGEDDENGNSTSPFSKEDISFFLNVID